MPKCAEQSTRHGARWNVHDPYCSSVQCFTCSHIKPSSKVPDNWKCWWTSLIWSSKSYRSQNWPTWRDNPFEISVHVMPRSCASNLNIMLLVRTACEFKTNGFPFRRTQKNHCSKWKHIWTKNIVLRVKVGYFIRGATGARLKFTPSKMLLTLNGLSVN